KVGRPVRTSPKSTGSAFSSGSGRCSRTAASHAPPAAAARTLPARTPKSAFFDRTATRTAADAPGASSTEAGGTVSPGSDPAGPARVEFEPVGGQRQRGVEGGDDELDPPFAAVPHAEPHRHPRAGRERPEAHLGGNGERGGARGAGAGRPPLAARQAPPPG